jgi:hypothetical protein
MSDQVRREDEAVRDALDGREPGRR